MSEWEETCLRSRRMHAKSSFFRPSSLAQHRLPPCTYLYLVNIQNLLYTKRLYDTSLTLSSSCSSLRSRSPSRPPIHDVQMLLLPKKLNTTSSSKHSPSTTFTPDSQPLLHPFLDSIFTLAALVSLPTPFEKPQSVRL